MSIRRPVLTLAVLASLAAAGSAVAAVDNFSNATPIVIGAGAGAAGSPYPSTINVSGLTGTITDVTVTLSGVAHTWPEDLDVLLVSPDGQLIKLISDSGGSTDITGVNLTFSANVGTTLTGAMITSGTYLPSEGPGAIGDDIFPAPAPAGPYSFDLQTLDGTASDQHGNWQLYVRDDASDDGGSIAGGWSLSITTNAPSFVSCADEGYSGDKLKLCKLVCEIEFPPALHNLWLLTWTRKYQTDPPCAEEQGCPDVENCNGG